MKGERKILFIQCICVVLEYGKQKELNAVGEWAIMSAHILFQLLKCISDATEAGFDRQVLLREVFNKCLVQHSTVVDGWHKYKHADNTITPSLHIRQVLEACPDIPRTTDGDGRLSLHYAVGASSASYEAIMDIFNANPKAASVRDPASRLFPFMLAGSNDNVSASFRLLLADPSLVASGVQVDDNSDGKKRKRSLSMGGSVQGGKLGSN